MECLVCKHRFIRVKNYRRHLEREHPEVNVDDVITQTPSKGRTLSPMCNTELRLMIYSPLSRVTSVRGHFGPIKRRALLTELASMCESYSDPAKSGPIKRLTRLNSDPIKQSRLYVNYYRCVRILIL